MKLSQESVILIVCALGIGALIVAKTYPMNVAAVSPEAPVDVNGFSPEASVGYTQYNAVNNAAGYNLGPPVINALPAQTMGLVGGAAAALGCKTCG